MTPMTPMPRVGVRLLERVGRGAPFAGRRLAREHEPSHAHTGEPFDAGGNVLSPTSLRVQGMPHIVMKLANRDGAVLVHVPPDGNDVGERLASTVPLFSLTHPRNWILTTQRQQWIADPTGPLLKAAERKAGFDILCYSTPTPDCQ
jgi:hypothetical protein